MSTSWRKRIAAGALAATTMLAGLAPANALEMSLYGGGSGSAGGSTPTGSGKYAQGWTYHDWNGDNYGGRDVNNVLRALEDIGFTYDDSGKANAQAAMDAAFDECEAQFAAAHPGETADCRIVAVGAVAWTGGSGKPVVNNSTASRSVWARNWTDFISGTQDSPRFYANNDQQYTTFDPFSDDPTQSANTLAEKVFGDVGKGSVSVVVLNQYQPVPAKPKTYDLTITTTQQSVPLKACDSGDDVCGMLDASLNARTCLVRGAGLRARNNEIGCRKRLRRIRERRRESRTSPPTGRARRLDRPMPQPASFGASHAEDCKNTVSLFRRGVSVGCPSFWLCRPVCRASSLF